MKSRMFRHLEEGCVYYARVAQQPLELPAADAVLPFA